MHIDISVFYILLVIFIAYFSELVPITVAGLGTRELIIIQLLLKLGYKEEQAVTFSLLFIVVIFLNIVTGFISWTLKPIELKAEAFNSIAEKIREAIN